MRIGHMSDRHEVANEFIESIPLIGKDLTVDEPYAPIAWQLAIGSPDEHGRKKWRPVEPSTDSAALDPIYAKLPARFPPLYEQLV